MPGQLPPYRPSLFDRVLAKAFGMINKVVPWYKFPGIIGVINLEAIRTTLRRNNLHDGYPPGHAVVSMAEPEPTDERFLHARNSDGKYNSLTMPRMGCAGMRFGRQFPREYCRKPTEEELWNPNPRVISERFMKRREGGFIPATTLNLLAAAWIQFQTHDWMAHEKVRRGQLVGENVRHRLTNLGPRLTTRMTFLFQKETAGQAVGWNCSRRSPTRSSTPRISKRRDTRT